MNKRDNPLNLPLSTRLKKSENVPWRIIEGEAILVDIDRGEAIQLNVTAAKIWEFIDGKNTIGQIMENIYNFFEVSKEDATRDCIGLIEKLMEKNLINGT